MLHTIQRDQTSCSPETCFAVYGNRALLLLNCFQKLINNVIWRRRTIKEVEIQVIDASFHEFLFLILRFVESNYQLNSKLFKDRNVILRCKRAILVCNV